MDKTIDDILKQPYMSAKDLKIIIPSLGVNKCVEYIKQIRLEMQEKGYFVPETKEYLALTKLVKKKFGL